MCLHLRVHVFGLKGNHQENQHSFFFWREGFSQVCDTHTHIHIRAHTQTHTYDTPRAHTHTTHTHTHPRAREVHSQTGWDSWVGRTKQALGRPFVTFALGKMPAQETARDVLNPRTRVNWQSSGRLMAQAAVDFHKHKRPPQQSSVLPCLRLAYLAMPRTAETSNERDCPIACRNV